MTTPSRAALVTGSGRNIGRAIALRLARNGFRVIVNGSSDRDACDSVVESIQSDGGEAMVAMGDVGIQADATRIANAGIEAWGAIDVLVNNASIRPGAAFLDIKDEDWQRVMAVDFYASVWLSQACLPAMLERGWGRIVNFSGRNAIQGSLGRPHVAAAKHAALGLTRSLANEFGRQGVTCNMISPGVIVGEVPDTGVVGARYEKFTAESPVGHLGTPDNIAAMVDLLVSEDGNFINGQMLQINGGVVY